jgi:hypothetical protein
MKKILSWILALLMLTLPVLGAAEAPAAEDVSAALAGSSFSAKYLMEGQRSVSDVTVEPGIVLLSLIPEDYQQAVQDLLAALKIELTGQAVDKEAQGTLRLILNDKDAANVTLALGEQGIYAASSFLGDTIVQLTPEDLQKLMDQATQQMVASGQISQEDLDKLKAGMSNPEELISSMIGNPDPSALMTAVLGLVNPEDIKSAEVTELPEDVTIEATEEMTLVIRKEALAKVTTELAKLLWSMPVVQQLGEAAAQNGGEPLTEEKLIAGLNKIPEVLAEDLTVRMYTTKEGNPTQILMAPKILKDGKETEMKFSAITEMLDDGVKISWTAGMPQEGTDLLLSGDLTLNQAEKGGTLTYLVTADVTRDGETYRIIDMNCGMKWTAEEALRTLDMNYTATILQEPGAAPMTFAFTVASEEKDLGDHAEETAKVDVTIQDALLMTLNVNTKTDMAEAYIISEDAVRPAALSEEEMQSFTQSLSTNATSGLLQLLTALPESAQTMVFSLINNSAQ